MSLSRSSRATGTKAMVAVTPIAVTMVSTSGCSRRDGSQPRRFSRHRNVAFGLSSRSWSIKESASERANYNM